MKGNSSAHIRLGSILWQVLVGSLLLNLLWWLASIILDRPTLINPWIVYQHLPQLMTSRMAEHLWASLLRVLIGIPIAMVLGIAVAWLIFRYRTAGRIISAFTYLSYPIPKLALLPVVMIIAGLGDVGKVTMIVLILLFQVIVNGRDSLTNIPKQSFMIATSLGARASQVLRHIILPATLPDILSTLRVAIGTAISVLFVTETYGTDRGMGYFIIDSWMRLDYLSMYGGIVILSLIGFLLFVLTDIIEVCFCSWRETVSPPLK